MSNKTYKLVEVTHEEHVALGDAGAWVQFDVCMAGGTPWWHDHREMLSRHSYRMRSALVEDLVYKFYTRVECDE